MAADHKRLGKLLKQLVIHGDNIGSISHIQHQHNELITADPGNGIGLTEAELQALGDHPQQIIPHRMSQRIIDNLETIHIQKQQGKAGVHPVGKGAGLLQAVGQQHPVGQAGQGVIAGNVFKLLLMGFLRTDVGEQRDEMLCSAIGLAYRADREQLGVKAPILAPVPHFATPVSVLEQRIPHCLIEFAGLVPGLEQAGRVAQGFITAIGGDPGEGFVDIEDGAIRCGDHDAFPGMAEHGCQLLELGIGAGQCPGFLQQCGFGLLAPGDVTHHGHEAQPLVISGQHADPDLDRKHRAILAAMGALHGHRVAFRLGRSDAPQRAQ
ncbi:hypothetical protein SDC9_149213 [bioreactor metagenome]|uniref:Uncharacterized protein n=1 Tax=bioreactor metagenome TaxID=1076179 RepID=A0A645EKZ7_9ZZZZ